MANNEFARFSKKVVSYFWDPLPRNEDPSPIWCLGRSYDSRYQEARQAKPPGTSPSSHSDSSTSQADSAIITQGSDKPKGEQQETRTEALEKSQADLSRQEEEALGWPPEFLDDIESRIWLTYRNNFPPIPKSSDPSAGTGMSFATRLRNIGNKDGFSSDTGWGCMIRSGQSLLANSLATLRYGREWRKGEWDQEHKELLALFADDPEAPFSIHKMVEHGAQACDKHPGEWFGPSAAARCIQALTNRNHSSNLRVYARPDDSDVYLDSLLATATQHSANNTDFQPTLIVLGIRLGIDRITPVYHSALKQALELPQSVGIAGGRPSSSHYFIGHQGDQFFYLDPHSTRLALPTLPHMSAEDVETCHTRRVRRVGMEEMDPSMLMGFLIKDREDFESWRKEVEGLEGKAIIHVHEREPRYALGVERAGAVDEVETWDETGEEEEDGEEGQGKGGL